MESGFELFDHTADMGVRVWAANPPALIPVAAEGLYATIGELVPGPADQAFEFKREGHESELLLRDFLTELLVLFERGQRILTEFDSVDFCPDRLRVSGRTATIDSDASTLFREVKAVTYHELAIREIAGGAEALFIVDI